ncbi:hypothetical protein BN3662_00637 [Clostridiales bacterium CHKCI006]|nr:hypothetical protein BN3662_00637 [Clostridiales bacterium CHKCI006]
MYLDTEALYGWLQQFEKVLVMQEELLTGLKHLQQESNGMLDLETMSVEMDMLYGQMISLKQILSQIPSRYIQIIQTYQKRLNDLYLDWQDFSAECHYQMGDYRDIGQSIPRSPLFTISETLYGQSGVARVCRKEDQCDDGAQTE